jgi:hypothetical protein
MGVDKDFNEQRVSEIRRIITSFTVSLGREKKVLNLHRMNIV